LVERRRPLAAHLRLAGGFQHAQSLRILFALLEVVVAGRGIGAGVIGNGSELFMRPALAHRRGVAFLDAVEGLRWHALLVGGVAHHSGGGILGLAGIAARDRVVAFALDPGVGPEVLDLVVGAAGVDDVALGVDRQAAFDRSNACVQRPCRTGVGFM